ncbi:MAG: ferrous iron transporter B [Spirochaetia bacterium]|jgi:ferrous iron transport protein B|nr:ferrous iron transporter B [Spirochaetia bacterium]
MSIKIALAGNPNSGKTTLFNALTGSNQFIGNWPGVTVEKKEGKLKGYKDVKIMDLPGIYSLSPYSLEEVISRNYLLNEQTDCILNIVDGSNLERNLFLTAQLLELGIPVVVAVNMMDVVDKSGDVINIQELSTHLGCPVIPISALKGTGIQDAVKAALNAAEKLTIPSPLMKLSGKVEAALASIVSMIDAPSFIKRFYAVKIFERDSKFVETYKAPSGAEAIIASVEKEFDDDSESIITTDRYRAISKLIGSVLKKKKSVGLSISDKIDRVVTNRFLALPIFAVVIFIIYFVSVTTVGTWVTDWTNDGLFGDGWHLTGGEAYEAAVGDYEGEGAKVEAYLAAADKAGIDTAGISETLEAEEPNEEVVSGFIKEASAANLTAETEIKDEDGNVTETLPVSLADFETALAAEEPAPEEFGVWVPGISALAASGLGAIGTSEWLSGLVVDGIIAGVGAVIGFVPQMLVLFLFLAALEACGYMARIAFILDRIFRRFGLSGKSFIPMLVGTGCGIPGVMASRTIENEKERRMTVMITTFMPCGAKLPVIALISGAVFGGVWWVAPSAYFLGVFSVVISGLMLKKMRMFASDPSPFLMELPAYHVPTVENVLRSMWERGWSFIKKAGTLILISAILIWFLSSFGFTEGGFGMVEDLSQGLLANIGGAIAWIFAPLGFGTWDATVATITGLIAKENVVGTMGVLYGVAEVSENGEEVWATFASHFTLLSAYTFLVFNLYCPPCFAAMGAIKREMNNTKWFLFAIGYQILFAYLLALIIFQLGSLIGGGAFTVGSFFGFAALIFIIFMVARPKFRKPTQLRDVSQTV